MRFESKRALVERIEREHAAFIELARSIPTSRYREAGVWGDGWNIADLFAHLSQWHRLLLGWVDDARCGRQPELPAPGYTWRETPRLNRAIQRKHARRSVAHRVAEFDATHAQVLALVNGLRPALLLEPGRFAWTGKLPLASYIAPNTCSHYAAARKILARWLKGQSLRAKGARSAARDAQTRKRP